MNCHNHPDRKATQWRRGVERADLWSPVCEECAINSWPGKDVSAAWERDQQGTYDSPHYNDYVHERVFPRHEYEIIRGGKRE